MKTSKRIYLSCLLALYTGTLTALAAESKNCAVLLSTAEAKLIQLAADSTLTHDQMGWQWVLQWNPNRQLTVLIPKEIATKLLKLRIKTLSSFADRISDVEEAKAVAQYLGIQPEQFLASLEKLKADFRGIVAADFWTPVRHEVGMGALDPKGPRYPN